jgi:hypothetical protein
MTARMQQCYVQIIGNPHWNDPRPFFRTNLSEIHQVAARVLEESGFPENTGIDRFVMSVTIAFYNPPCPGKISATLRTVLKEKSAVVSWDIFPRNLPDNEQEWVSVYIALLVDSIERLLHKFKIDATEVRRLRSISPRPVDLTEHFQAEVYSPWQTSTTAPRFAPDACPQLIAIDHDDYHARYVGQTSDERQFFLTTPFIPATDDEGKEFLALYLFDGAGNFLDAKIDEFGSRATMDIDAAAALEQERLLELGCVTFQRIVVKPFCIEKFGTSFGLIPRSHDDDTGSWSVEVQPGNYMAFHKPWDSGFYDT